MDFILLSWFVIRIAFFQLSDSAIWRSKLEPVLADLPSSASSSELSASIREIEKCRRLCWVPAPEDLLWPTPAYNASVTRRLIRGEEGGRGGRVTLGHWVQKQFLKIEVKFMYYKTYHFKVNNSVACSPFIISWNHHVCLVAKHFHHSRENLVSIKQLSSTPPPSFHPEHPVFLFPWTCLFGYVTRMEPYNMWPGFTSA